MRRLLLTVCFASLSACSHSHEVGAPDGGTTPDGATSPTTPGTVSVLAGTPNGPGNLDGVGTLARFAIPSYLVEDGAGSIFVTDHNGLRRIDTTTGAVTSAAGQSYAEQLGGIVGQDCTADPDLDADGVGTAARFNTPGGLASDHAGHVFVADTCNHAIRTYDVASSTTSTPVTLASTVEPSGLAWDAGTFYVSDLAAHAVLSVAADGTPTTISTAFERPQAIVVGSGALYITDHCAVQKLDLGSKQVTTLAGQIDTCGATDGTSTTARLGGTGESGNVPGLFGLVSDGKGALYVASADSTVQKIDIATGSVTTIVGMHGVIGAADGKSGTLSAPTGLAISGTTLYIADTGNCTVRTFDSSTSTLTTSFGISPVPHTGTDGKGAAASFVSPAGLTVDATGTLYVVDSGALSVSGNTIRKIATDGTVTTLAGSATESGSTDGTGAAARFDTPDGIVLVGDALYVTDTGNDTIRKVTLDGTVTTLAGAVGQPGSVDGTGGNARFDAPNGITSDGKSTLYVADSNGSTIRAVDTTSGAVTTVAGSASNPGVHDGVGVAAGFGYPEGIVYLDGALYVSDDFVTLRKIDLATKTVTTLAGAANASGGSADGVGAAASFDFLLGLTTDGTYVYAADDFDAGVLPLGGATVRRIDPATGTVTTVLGSPGVLGVLPGAVSTTRMNQPNGLAWRSGHLYISDAAEGLVLDAAFETSAP